MSDSATASTVRSASRRTAAPEPTGPFVIDAGDGFTVTVTATGETPGVKTVKNALERATRLARKALSAGITEANPFMALLAAVAEAERLAKASKEASDRVNRSLVEHRTEPAVVAAIGPNVSLPLVPTGTSVENHNG